MKQKYNIIITSMLASILMLVYTGVQSQDVNQSSVKWKATADRNGKGPKGSGQHVVAPPPSPSDCTPNDVGNNLLASLDYLAANHLLSGTVSGSTPNLIPNGDFEKDLSGLILQSTGLPADYHCICTAPGVNCNSSAQCDASGSSSPTYYTPSNFTDMMGYLEFKSDLKYQWAWSASIATGYFSVKNVHNDVNSAYTDHTSLAYGYGGQGFLVDGPDGTSCHKKAWYKPFTLLPNRTYKFSYWFLGFPHHSGSAAQFAFGIPKDDGSFGNMTDIQIDDVPFTGTLPYVPSDELWHKFSGTFQTTTSNTVTIAIFTYCNGSFNNDCVFDDLSMVQTDGCANNTWSEIFADHIQISIGMPTLTGGCTACGVNLIRMPGDAFYDFSHIQHITNLRPDPNFPGSRNAFLVDIDIWDPARPGADPRHDTMSGYFGCDYIFDCREKKCCVITGDQVNPFVQGLRGNWRANKAYIYNADRQYDPTPTGRINPNQGLYTRQSGIYDQFTDFWQHTKTGWTAVGATDMNWSWKAEVTKMNPYGADVENKDPLDRFSSAIYGYNYSAAIAVGNNTRYRQMAYDGFEDYDFFDPTCEVRHFNIEKPTLSDKKAHTGLRSLPVESGNKVIIKREITPYNQPDPAAVDPSFASPYTVAEHDLLGVFRPDDNNDYVLSFWTYEALEKEDGGQPKLDADYFNYPDPKINIVIGGVLTAPLTELRGKVIERWQQITYTFKIPTGSSDIELQYLGEMSGKKRMTYYDDVRIFPIKATMKSYVYNPITLKLMAQLDENNYATFYEYDLEGKLNRVKKETEKGIYTIQESRTSMPKQ